MNAWQHNANIVLQEKRDDSANILIDFYKRNHGDKVDFDGRGGVVAHAFPPRSSGIGGDIHLDQDEVWDFSCNKGEKQWGKISFLYAFLHELGHSLGLIYHINNPHSVMTANYPFAFSLENNINFYEIDVNEIAQIYGKKQSYSLIPRREAKLTTIKPTTSNKRPQNSGSIKSRMRSFIKTSSTTNPPVNVNDEYKPATTPSDIVVKLCEDSYDTVALFRGETWIFKGSNMWRITSYGETSFPIGFMFRGLENVTKIDSLFIDHVQLYIHFFAEREAYTFSIAEGLKIIRKQSFRQLNYNIKVSRIKGVIESDSSLYAIFDNEAQIIDTNLRALPGSVQQLSDNKFHNISKLNFDVLSQDFNTIYLLNGDYYYEINTTTLSLRNDKMLSIYQKFGKCETWMTKSGAQNLGQNFILISIATIVISVRKII
jgi:hypothetical protein